MVTHGERRKGDGPGGGAGGEFAAGTGMDRGGSVVQVCAVRTGGVGHGGHVRMLADRIGAALKASASVGQERPRSGAAHISRSSHVHPLLRVRCPSPAWGGVVWWIAAGAGGP